MRIGPQWRAWCVTLAVVGVAGIPGNSGAGQAPTDSADLFDRNPSVREEAVRALGARGESALPDLLRALFDEDRRVRGAAVEALTDVGGDHAAEVLAAAVHDTDDHLREDVVYAARRIGGQRAKTVVELLLADPAEAVREAARVVFDELLNPAGAAVRTPRGSRPSGAAKTDAP